jgi:hypothetical protein
LNTVTASIHADAQFSSHYLTVDDLDPLGYNGNYTVFNAGIRVGAHNHSWEVGLLCRNCNNRIYVVNGSDGGAVPSAVIQDIAQTRQIYVQVSVKPNHLL